MNFPDTNTITKDFLIAQIESVTYTNPIPRLTHCIITVKNGYLFTGESCCVDINNYNKEIGEEVAYEDAIQKMWSSYGFLLKEQLYLKESSSYLDRLLTEAQELEEKTSKLATFLKLRPVNITDDEEILLTDQLKVMSEYLTLLNRRIANTR